MIRRSLVVVTLITLAVTACDREPTDPNFDFASLIAASGAVTPAEFKPVGSTLPSLFREAIAKTEQQQGRIGVDALLTEWRDMQNDLTKIAPTASRAVLQEKLDAIHTEELDVVLRALGTPVIERVMSDASVGLAAAEAQLASAKLQDNSGAESVIRQAREKIALAHGSIAAKDLPRALDLGSQAVTLVTGLNFYFVELQRINGIETLYPRAVETLKAKSDPDAETMLAAAERSSIAARAAMRMGDRESAQARLTEARTHQIDVVLKVLGPSTVTQLVNQTTSRTTLLRNVVDTLGKSGRDVTRFKRMLIEANDLSKRAKAALEKGDTATALDLGSHAAGMLNALQHLAWK